jgi:hypothetical protein
MRSSAIFVLGSERGPAPASEIGGPHSAPDNRATQMSRTLTLSRQRERELEGRGKLKIAKEN